MNWKKQRKKIRRAVKYSVLVFLIRAFVLFVRLFSRKFILRICSRFGKIAFHLVKVERQKTIDNLSHIYGEVKSEPEIYAMAKQVFVHQALNFGDYVHTLHYTTREQFSEIVDVVGEEHLKKAYEEGKGVLCLMSHAGLWEFSAILPSVLGYETSALSRPMPNPRIDKLIVGYREKRGMKNIGRLPPGMKIYPVLLEVIEKRECLIIMIDQDTTVKGIFIDFFGKRAYTPVGAARLAMDTKAPVVPMFMKRLADNRHQLTILPPVPIVDTGNEEEDLRQNTINYTAVIEQFIVDNPEQWVWMHERWKTTPESLQLFFEKKREKERLLAEANKE
jgi:Kdo2-lipid IVA lauroyltransferase/acyltransferase